MKIVLILFLLITQIIGKTNALIDSESPYLLQHAHNPVKWHPYNENSLNLAKQQNKLIFLSIGYSTCHWCHVMEEESFEDENISKLLNRDYISIKVDKEEMPEIDVFYQHIHSKLKKGRNGWPLSVIMTKDAEVLHIATYIPPNDDYATEGMTKLLPRLAKLKDSTQLLEKNKKLLLRKDKEVKIDKSISSTFIKKMQNRYDKIYKGFDKRPKFPLASHLNALLQIYLLDGNKTAYKMVEESVDAMSSGGIYDQVEGGFFRYSVLSDWIIPHFEKMLYSNAELISLYTKMYQLSKKPIYKKIVNQSINEMSNRYKNKNLFYAASDADTNGKEGGYFTYTYDEVYRLLKKQGYSDDQIEESLDYFDIIKIGNFFNDLNNVHFNTGFDKKPKLFQEIKKHLLYLRKQRKFPFIDKKIITSWNAMMIKALFEASMINNKYSLLAEKSLDTLLNKHYVKDILYHQSIGNKAPKRVALLEDYSFLIAALLKAYQTTFKAKYLKIATHLAKESIQKFYKNDKWYLNKNGLKVLSQYKDKYYTAPLSEHFHNLLDIANLNYDLKLLKNTKQYIENERKNILTSFDKSPRAIMALLRLEHETIILKSKKENLLKNKTEIDKITYPFILKKIENTDTYLLCNESSCFSNEKNLTKIISSFN